ncbi:MULTISPECIES: TAXI family TRAP transporter solute-binding subunit [Micromonospora]|uniref:TAXI family TRAP transporter solute-binding subunit n=1 Tax=Micromonospora solifontis TaxID=2487138 RepID=A0ABX9WD57_9ACTN|nr:MULTISPECIES: TAXI family TRAP transporter solute-binding subunit [Micromonospora]NES16603.1 TAXI family TRAP transporter solute-binding subunit [Micromonospora sp. PPF5-17B]NES39246.1 TAXI family TRAP transporter solute-binding subunit [Micromonospora solifontis]NES58382.1 TAXI family TRAP transporter solute-binding subunit [Micromonospora sp. PPF5-6]RNL89831.1 TAXI family TRAP transporter solute-binding subunit [Micromonospora solifontis]
MTRRPLRLLAALLLAAVAAGCGAAPAGPQEWHGGRIFLATGNTTGVYYQLGGGYADVISRHLPGYEARAEPTGASVENINRLAGGDMEVAFSLADTAADAVAGRGAFDGQAQPVRALARIYSNYTHVIVRTDGKIDSFAKLRGKRISTGSPKSGTDIIAGRLLTAAGIDPDRDIQRLTLSLPETVKRMRAGSLDAMFFSGGLPTPGIKDLLSSAPGKFRLLPIADLIEPLAVRYGAVYTTSTLPKEVYGTPAATPTITVSNVILVRADMPDQLAYDLTRLLFTYQGELIKVHPEAANFTRESAAATGPIPLHPGASRYYGTR